MKAYSLTKQGRALLLLEAVRSSKTLSGLWIRSNCIYLVFEKLEKNASLISSTNVQLSVGAVL